MRQQASIHQLTIETHIWELQLSMNQIAMSRGPLGNHKINFQEACLDWMFVMILLVTLRTVHSIEK